MKTKDYLEEYLRENLIEKIYENDLYVSIILPKEKEYINTNKRNIELSNKILKKIQGETRYDFIEYMENVHIKESIEAKHQFKLGFQTAIKLIIDGLGE